MSRRSDLSSLAAARARAVRVAMRERYPATAPAARLLPPRPRPGQEIPDVEQHLHHELVAHVGALEIGHPGPLARRLGALERLAVDGLQVGQDAVAGTHGRLAVRCRTIRCRAVRRRGAGSPEDTGPRPPAHGLGGGLLAVSL